MIELHGGKLELKSALGLGTTATLVFPKSRIVGPGKKDAADGDVAPSRHPAMAHAGQQGAVREPAETI
jgi:hypothetical protein